MNHLYEDKNKILHTCLGSQIHIGNPDTYLVWTKCGKDVPANKSFRSVEEVTCPECLETRFILCPKCGEETREDWCSTCGHRWES